MMSITDNIEKCINKVFNGLLVFLQIRVQSEQV